MSDTPHLPPRPGETPPYKAAAMRPKAWRGEPYFTPAMPEATFYVEVNRGLIEIIKVGAASWVVTSHSEYWQRRKAFNEANKATAA